MSIPSDTHDFLVASVVTTPVSPFVRNHAAGFPSVTSPRLVRYSAMVLSRTIEEAETIGELIVANARTEACPMRVTSVGRDYEPAYDGERQGIYIHTTSLEFFST